jgi:class 3 adenylate cyclase/tetratricopeptide (TPR) repeat protein
MKCPKCQFVNEEGSKFCLECGERLELVCPQCGKTLPLVAKFCNECGQNLDEAAKKEKMPPEPEGERKHVTALFSDLSGYTSMSERLDPEEVKEIMSRIFGEIAQVVTRYEGFIEKFVGDAVMALFGVPKAHEDDAIRAIRAAREVHELIENIGPEVEKKTGQPIFMHTGINTGLVITGEVDTEKGTHGVSGDTINLAARLSSLAKAGEILVGPDTYRQAEGHFTFEALEPTTVKGKAEPVQVHKVLSPKERPVTVHRLSGLRAELIGRRAEIAQLREAVENLREGEGRIFSVCGDAGTGKSRLVEEFKASLDLHEIQWVEGHAYAYAQNIPYFPMIDLFNRVFHIEEGDPPEKVREKIEAGIEDLIGKKEDVVPYMGSLYALSYPEVEDVAPDFWKSQLRSAVQMILSALARKAPTVFYLEDLHWADPSFVELLRSALLEVQHPAIVLCVYRPSFSLFTGHQLGGIGKIYQEIRLQDLSTSEAQDMLESLLQTDTVPQDLRLFVQGKAEGNPFYLEELVNALIESEMLLRDNGGWKAAGPISESDISSTIHGLVSSRLDRLEKETKRILQEASVIGRAFFYEILKRVTELERDIDRSLRGLEQLDLIRTRSLQPDLEYVFKHALTQEVVYNGLLKKERQTIHERIALVMERIFQDRLAEFYETLAYHFKQGQSARKAVEYLMRSGEKSLSRYAVDEAQEYYKEAFDILTHMPQRSREDEELLIDLLVKWAFVFYYRGDFRGLTDLLGVHEDLAKSLKDKARLGMFYGWLGMALWCREKFRLSYENLKSALKLGEEVQDQKVIGYACTWLTWTCAELGLLDDALQFGQRAQEISRSLPSDHYLYLKSMGGIGHTYCYRGERKKALETGKALIEYGQRHSNSRCLVMGYWVLGFSDMLDGDFSSAIEHFQKGVQVSADPYYSQIPRLGLGMSYAQNGEVQEAEESLRNVLSFSRDFGAEVTGNGAQTFLGLVQIFKGHMRQGLKTFEAGKQASLENERMCVYALNEYTLGRLYSEMAEGSQQVSLSSMAKNVGFLLKTVPFAGKKAEEHFNKAIEIAKGLGANGVLGRAYLDLGLLHGSKKRTDQARACISEAIRLFEETGGETCLRQAKEALASLNR